jgi:DNA-binding MarR family transcriptional regulator
LTLEQAQSLFAHWRRDEYGWLRVAIIRIAQRRGEFHADYIAAQELSERNMIGAAVQSLCKQGYLYSTGEHRRGSSKVGHGRRSYVYKLTEYGHSLARGLPPNEEKNEPDYEQRGLF